MSCWPRERARRFASARPTSANFSRGPQPASGEFVSWVHDLEIGRFGLPVPDQHLLLDVPRVLAGQRAAHRERTEPGRARDRYEADAGLQERTAVVYRELAATGWLAPWTVLDGAAEVDYAALARDLMG